MAIAIATATMSEPLNLENFHFTLSSEWNNPSAFEDVKPYLENNLLRAFLKVAQLENDGNLETLAKVLHTNWLQAADTIYNKVCEFCTLSPAEGDKRFLEENEAAVINNVALAVHYAVQRYLAQSTGQQQLEVRTVLSNAKTASCMVAEAIYDVHEQIDGPFSRALLSSAVRKASHVSKAEHEETVGQLEGDVQIRDLLILMWQQGAAGYNKMFENLLSLGADADAKTFVLGKVLEFKETAWRKELRQKDDELDKKTKEAAALRSQLKKVNARLAEQTEKA